MDSSVSWRTVTYTPIPGSHFQIHAMRLKSASSVSIFKRSPWVRTRSSARREPWITSESSSPYRISIRPRALKTTSVTPGIGCRSSPAWTEAECSDNPASNMTGNRAGNIQRTIGKRLRLKKSVRPSVDAAVNARSPCLCLDVSRCSLNSSSPKSSRTSRANL
jgi:hypothetical protein